MAEYSLNTQGNAWIMANAGSGKTYVLARRVIRLMLNGARPESIICLTYTKAAAAEMRERILSLLKKLAIHEGEDLSKELVGILGDTPTTEQLSRAPKLLDSLLDSPLGGVQITTIHGFCQRLLKYFPLEAGISPHAQLLDEREQSELIQHVVRRLYMAEDDTIKTSLSFIASIVAEGRLNQWLSQLLYKRSDWESLTTLPTHDAIRHTIESRYPLTSYERTYWEEKLQPALGEQHIRQIIGILMQGGKDQQSCADSLTHWLDTRDTQNYLLALLTQKYTPRQKVFTEKLFGGQQIMLQSILAEQARLVEVIEALGIVAAAEETYHIAILARTANQLYAQLKHVRSALDYDDLIAHIERLFAHDLPWVMTKLDYRIDHVLLDEAQDTSPAQWRITQTLIQELFAVESASGMERSLFVVGDEKQSIYSFQGAAPEMFASMRDAWQIFVPIDSHELSRSFRSSAPVLQLANAICDVEHTLHREGEAGLVELWPLVEQPEKAEQEAYHIPSGYTENVRAEAMLALQIAGTIRLWLDEKRQLPARGRVIEPGDIMILVHRRKPMTPLLIAELQRNNIPVAGIDRLALSSHLAVKDMIALMRWLYTPEDDLALAQILRSPLVGFSEQQLFELAHQRNDVSLWHRLRPQAFLENLQQRKHLTPYGFLHRLLEVDGKRQAYASRFGHEIHEILDALLEHAFMCEEDGLSMFDYALQLEQSAREIKREFSKNDGQNEVRIMTVHGAKGLEAPIVILADTTTKPDTSKELWLSGPSVSITDDAKRAPYIAALKEKRLEALHQEYKRLLYVAATRAEDELYIAGATPSQRKVEDSWYDICLRALKQIPTVEESNGVYRLSAPQTKSVKHSSDKEHTAITLPAWLNKPIATEVVQGSFSPSRLSSADLTLYGKSEGDARTRGVIIHQLLELGSANADIGFIRALANYLAPDWSEADRANIAESVHKLLSHDEISWLWKADGYNEASIAGTLEISGTSYPMNGQIDRLVITENQIVILDYKTSNHIPETVAETPVQYLLQMKAYKELLAKKYKGKKISCALLWTYAPRLDWLDDILAKTVWEQPRQAA